MKILWVVNIIFSYPSEKIGIKSTPFGGWLLGLYNKIIKNENINLAIVTTYKGRNFKKIIDKNTIYYLIPSYNPCKETKKMNLYCKNIIKEFSPNLVHIHGTEFILGRVFQKHTNNFKNIVSIQGLKYEISNYYYANIEEKEFIKNFTIKSLIKGGSIREKKNFKKQGLIEKKILDNADAVIGRTVFDYSNTVEFINKDKYYKINESLRDEFYNNIWDINNIEKHSIYISQGMYPIKGLHIMIESLNILKNIYPDIKLYIAGKDFLNINNIVDYIKFSDYQKYIIKLIKKYKLKKYIEFTDLLDAKGVVKRLLKTNVFIQASSIENSSNALGEAMILGVPCVASFVGGTSDLINDKEEGYLYPFGDYGQLSHYISKVFDELENTQKISNNARKHALITHNSDKNYNDMINLYRKVISE